MNPRHFLQKRYGKLTVVNFGKQRNVLIWVLSCACGQLVYMGDLPQYKDSPRCCQKCSYKAQRKWKSGEIAVTRMSIRFIPAGEQVIVERQTTTTDNPLLIVEYQGKHETCSAANLQSLKVIF